jgi:hypothetical protein
MKINPMRYSALKRFTGLVCFALFGMVGTFRQGQEFSLPYLLYGAVVGFAFGWISMFIMAILLRLINPGLGKMYKGGFARKAVAQGMVFLVPFALMAFIAAYALHWKSSGLFVSAAVAAVAVATGEEVSKLYDKPRLWNNIVPSIVASGCSMVWLYLIVQVQSFPSAVVSLYSTVTMLMSMTQ